MSVQDSHKCVFDSVGASTCLLPLLILLLVLVLPLALAVITNGFEFSSAAVLLVVLGEPLLMLAVPKLKIKTKCWALVDLPK